jgi:hypothetical protein
MTFVTRIGTFINASVSGLANTMSARTGLRSFLSLAIFFVIFVVAYAELDSVDGERLGWEFWKLKDDELREQENDQHSFAVSFFFFFFFFSLPFLICFVACFSFELSLTMAERAGYQSRLQIPATAIPRRSQKGLQVGSPDAKLRNYQMRLP